MHLHPLSRQNRPVSLAVALVLSLLFLLGGCAALSRTAPKQVHPGIDYQLLKPRPEQVVHLLRIDLQHPGLQLALSPQDERGLPIDQMPSAQRALVAVNASFFDRAFRPRGLTRSEGKAWPEVMAAASSPLLDCDRQQRCQLQLRLPPMLSEHGWTTVAGTPWLVEQGRARSAADDASCPGLCQQTHPRTAVGLDLSGRWLMLALAEGRRGEVAGLRLAELAALMQQHGAHQALNLDGGGSSTLLIRGEARMARPFNEAAQRRIANALLVLERAEGR